MTSTNSRSAMCRVSVLGIVAGSACQRLQGLGGVAMAMVLIALLHLFFVLDTARQKSPYFDEPSHIGTGYHLLKYRDYRVSNGNLVLGPLLAGLPLQSQRVHPVDDSLLARIYSDRQLPTSADFVLGINLLYKAGNVSQRMLWDGRLMMALCSVATIVIVGLWSSSIFGATAGPFASFLLACCPPFIALAGIIGADMPVTFCFTIAMFAVWRLLHAVTPTTCIGAGVACGLLAGAKLSAVLFAPMVAALIAWRMIGGGPLHVGWTRGMPVAIISSRPRIAGALLVAACGSLCVAWATIWSLYGFRYDAIAPGMHGSVDWSHLQRLGELARTNHSASMLLRGVECARSAKMLPEAYLRDLSVLPLITGARLSFLCGMVSVDGHWWYFPFTFILKSGLAFLSVLILAAWAAVGGDGSGRRWWREPWPYEMGPLLIFVIVYSTAAMSSSLNIGHRHLLPVYPFLAVFAGIIPGRLPAVVNTRWPVTVRKLAGWAIAICAGIGLDAALAHPHHLAYICPAMRPWAAPFQLVADSSLEWGQELPAVRRWLEKKCANDESRAYFAYFGSVVPGAHPYDIKAVLLPGFFDNAPTLLAPLEPGWYLVSATMLPPMYRRESEIDGRVPIGPWCDEYERWYQGHDRLLREILAIENTDLRKQRMIERFDGLAEQYGYPEKLRSLSDEEKYGVWAEGARFYDGLRFARLSCYLARRAPDDIIAESVLAYRLSRDELDFAQGTRGPAARQ